MDRSLTAPQYVVVKIFMNIPYGFISHFVNFTLIISSGIPSTHRILWSAAFLPSLERHPDYTFREIDFRYFGHMVPKLRRVHPRAIPQVIAPITLLIEATHRLDMFKPGSPIGAASSLLGRPSGFFRSMVRSTTCFAVADT